MFNHMKSKSTFLTNLFFITGIIMSAEIRAASTGYQASTITPDSVKLLNPVSVKYLKTNLRKSSPRLGLTPSLEKKLKRKIKSDAVVKNYYAAIKLNAEQIQQAPLLTREME